MLDLNTQNYPANQDFIHSFIYSFMCWHVPLKVSDSRHHPQWPPPPKTWESYLTLLSPHIQSVPKPSKGHYLLWHTELMLDGWLPMLPKVKFRLCKWDNPGGEVSALLIMAGRKQAVQRPTPHPPSIPLPSPNLSGIFLTTKLASLWENGPAF